MSAWQRKFSLSESTFALSEETKQNIARLKQRADGMSVIDCELTDSFFDANGIEMHLKNINANDNEPQEVTQARKVIQTWMEFENEANDIRCYGYSSKLSKHFNIKEHTFKNIKKQKKKKHKKSLSNIKIKQTVIKKYDKTSSFDLKFIRMKKQAQKRENNKNTTSKQNESIKNEIQSETKNVIPYLSSKAIMEHMMQTLNEISILKITDELKDESEAEIEEDIIYNAEKMPNKKNIQKQALIMQLKEIEKQEMFDNRKCIKIVFLVWKQNIRKQKNEIQKQIFIQWRSLNTKELQNKAFQIWNQLRIKSIKSERKANQHFNDCIKYQIFMNWMQTAKDILQKRKLHSIQTQLQFRKMKRIADKHFQFTLYVKYIQHWKQFLNNEQTKKYLNQKRNERQLKIKKLLENIHLKKMQKCKMKQIPKRNCNEIKTVSIQTQTSFTSKEIHSKEIIIHTKKKKKILKSMLKCKSISTLKTKTPNIMKQMEKRTFERQKKRRILETIKIQKENELQIIIKRKKNEEKQRLKAEKKRALAKQRMEEEKIKEMKKRDEEKYLLADMHYCRSLVIYHGWIPFMKYVEISKINKYKSIAFDEHQKQSQFWKAWKSVFQHRRKMKYCAIECAVEGKKRMSSQLFIISNEKLYWKLWRDSLLTSKMKCAIISEKHKLIGIERIWNVWLHVRKIKARECLMQQHLRDQQLIKEGEILLMKEMIHRWKENIIVFKREKKKNKTWKKVEIWLNELRAKA